MARNVVADLAGIDDPFLVARAEHGVGDLAVVVLRGGTDGIADDGNVGLMQNIWGLA